MRGLRIGRERPSFAHGVHPPEHKAATAGLAIERMPFAAELVLPLSQHIGAPAVPVVAAGERVARGQRIATAGGFVSTDLHAPAAGTISAIELRLHPSGRMQPAIVLTVDPYADQAPPRRPPIDPGDLDASAMVEAVQRSGLVGLGGAAFPTHVKFAIPEDKPVRHVIVNGCECEPYLSCDHRLMLERPEAVLRGTAMIMRQVGATRGTIGVEANKADAAARLRALAPTEIDVVVVAVKYPQGAEKMLIDAVCNRRVPAGGLPLDIGIVVNNVATTAALADYFDHGLPLIERVVTVSGAGLERPRNLRVPLGTSVREVIDYCGGLRPETSHVVLGGPMMGMAQKTLDVPVLKGTSGILALSDRAPATAAEYPCIRCGRCLDACPMYLNPTRLMQYARAEHVAGLQATHVLDCFECGSCTFVCPSNIPLVQWIRVGKGVVRQARAAS